MIWKLDKPNSIPEIIAVGCLGISVMTHLDGRVSHYVTMVTSPIAKQYS